VYSNFEAMSGCVIAMWIMSYLERSSKIWRQSFVIVKPAILCLVVISIPRVVPVDNVVKVPLAMK
jgi:hypothetical protein